ncbi:MAG: NAD(P)/FAD-dependent oxidoreductase [Rhodospirillales bacterium]|nr:NAD(P)/FAD-dependent oxidoreductase [Rhodospirillales bacterium]
MEKQADEAIPEVPGEPGAPLLHRDVVIIGAGFAGLACAKKLGGSAVSVLVVDRHNYHLFQPLLYQVATAALSPADITEPIRKILSPYANVDVAMDVPVQVDTGARVVRFANVPAVHYRCLVLATGSEYNYFGRDEWKAVAPGLKTIDDAREIRSRLLRNFEDAETCTDPVRQRMLMTTAVIGGGPTGVEMAGSIAELARWTLARDFRHIDPTQARTLLVEGGPRLLSAFPEELSHYARSQLERLGVTVLLGRNVENVTASGITVCGEDIPAALTVWGAGIRATPIAELIGVAADRVGRIRVAANLAVDELADVYALGDIALLEQDGSPLPALAQVAKQQGEHLGANLERALIDGVPVPEFRFDNRGNTAVIGRNAAVFDFGKRRMKGRLAWFLWALIHVYLLVGFQKRLLVTMQWVWRYFTYQRGARIIR